jgi:RNA polymerase subunit RPABC4/transcription elongation factor Spt4
MKTKECPSCAMDVDSKSKECPICNYEFPKQKILYQIIAVILILAIIWFIIL